ncbi:MAG: 16S rRNA (uracil(1498)-N(3))-methyltransferase [Pseudomonadota bacterium]
MAQAKAKIRLYVTADLGPGQEVALARDQAHYLTNVMRQEVGGQVLLFNGRDGEWRAGITQANKRECRLSCAQQTAVQRAAPDLWLCFAPIKKARTDFIAEKACEMGARRLVPVFTQHTNAERIRVDRLRAHAIEAAEQCGITSVPEVAEPVTLDRLLSDWPGDRQILFCDETGPRQTAREVLRAAKPGPWAILTGPEGGFSQAEVARLHAMASAHAVSLGPRILRADTAAVAALALWQSELGDWA